jgi:hypothetical protein
LNPVSAAVRAALTGFNTIEAPHPRNGTPVLRVRTAGGRSVY